MFNLRIFYQAKITFVRAQSIQSAFYLSVLFSVAILLARIARPYVFTIYRTPAGDWIDYRYDLGEDAEYFQEFRKHDSACKGILILRIDESLTYPNSGFVSSKIKRTIKSEFLFTGTQRKKEDMLWCERPETLSRASKPPLRGVVFDFSAVNHIDYSGLQVLLEIREYVERFSGRSVPIHFVQARPHQLHLLWNLPHLSDDSQNHARKSSSSSFDLEKGLKQEDFFHLSVDDAVEAVDKETGYLRMGTTDEKTDSNMHRGSATIPVHIPNRTTSHPARQKSKVRSKVRSNIRFSRAFGLL
jgi:MFS superfamily sulfate permease-like transporter